MRLYRLEPLAVAFTERFNILVPVNRAPSTAEEANQILEWVLAVEKVGGGIGYERVSQTSEDWVVAHRGAAPPRPPRRPRVLTAGVLTLGERSAPSIDPLVVRYEAMMDRPGGCAEPGDGLHLSQVLIYVPVDPGAADDATPRWEPDQELRVNLRQRNSPFVDRVVFEGSDATAFTPAVAGGFPATWRSDGGVMRVDADPQPAAAQYAVFGETDWRHMQIEVAVTPEGGEAGIAVAFLGSRSVEALVSSAGQLRLIERNGVTICSLATPVVVPVSGGPIPLEVVQYDDRVRATVSQFSVEGSLGDIREGRLALVSRGGGRFTRLQVGGIDAWRFHTRTSRYDDFAAHVASWDGVMRQRMPGEIGAASTTVADLIVQTAADVPAVMTEQADAETRQRLFEKWTTGLGLALCDEQRGVSITRWVDGSATPLILLESDEPLPFSRDVRLALTKRTRIVTPFNQTTPPIVLPRATTGLDEFLRALEFEDDLIVAPSFPARMRGARWILRAVDRDEAEAFDIDRASTEALVAVRARARVEWPHSLGTPQPGTLVFLDAQNCPLFPPFPPMPHIVWVPVTTLVLTNADETQALIVPVNSPLAGGTYHLRMDIDRRRWRVAVPDATSNYRATATIPLSWS